MPLIDTNMVEQQLSAQTTIRQLPVPPEDRISLEAVGGKAYKPELLPDTLSAPEPSFWEGVSSSIDIENSAVSLFNNLDSVISQNEFDPQFNPFEYMQGYEGYYETLGQAYNKKHFDNMLNDIKEQEADRQIIDKSGTFTQVAGAVAAGVTDPISYIGGGLAYRGLQGANSIIRGAGIGFASTALPEFALQQTQATRTNEDAAWNIIGGSLFGGALGAGAAGFRKLDGLAEKRIIQKLRQDITDISPDTIDVLRRNNMDIEATRTELLSKGVGADAIGKEIDKIKIYKESFESILKGESIKSAAMLDKVWSGITPLMRALNSPFLQTRVTMQKLLNTPFKMEKNAQGLATEQSVEKLSALYTTDYLLAADKTNKIYADYRKSSKEALPKSRQSLRSYAATKLSGKKYETSFNEEVGKALRRNGVHPNKHIQDAAKTWRKFFDDIGNEAVDAGIWKQLPDRKTAESYFTRMYDFDEIMENPKEFKAILREYIQEQTVKKVGAIETKYKRMQDNLQRKIDDLEINNFRKASELQERAELEGAEQGLTIEDIKSSLEVLAEGKVSKPQTMLEYIAKQGGIRPDDPMFGDFNLDDITAWAKTNRLRLANEVRRAPKRAVDDKVAMKAPKINLVNESYEGGRFLDDIGEDLWQEGFFPTYRDRPEIDEVLSAIDDELRDLNVRVRDADLGEWNDYQYYTQLKSQIDSLGIKPKDYAGGKVLLADDQLKALRDAYIKGSDLIAKRKTKLLSEKMGKLKAKQDEELMDIRQMGVDGYAEEVTEGLFNKIAGLDKVSPEFKFNVAERGPLKNITLLIPDERIEKFLKSDIGNVAERYARTIGADIELMNKFGSLKLEDVLRPIEREATDLLNATKTAEQRKAIKKALDNDKRDLTAAFELLRGTYAHGGDPDGVWARVVNTTLQFNYMRMMGGVTLSSIPDMGKLLLYNGFGNFYKDSFRILAGRVGGMNKELLSESIEDLRLAGMAIEHLRNQQVMSLADVSHRYSQRTMFENFMETSTQVFSKATGITYWNNLMHIAGGLMVQNRILRNVEAVAKGAKLKGKELEYMSKIGLDDKNIKKIADEWTKHGKIDNEFRVANLKDWSSPEARKLYRAAVNKDVESIVIRKDIGDVPLFANTPLGRLMLQFKSFMFATVTKTMMPIAQDRDKAMVQGMSTMMALGALTYILKSYAGGKEPDMSPEKLLFEGLDKSGLLGPIMEANNIWEKMGGYGMGRLTGAPVASRYASRSIAESLLGPTLGTINNVGGVVNAINAEGELSDSDRKNVRRLIPFNNLWAINVPMSNMDEQTKAKLGY